MNKLAVTQEFGRIHREALGSGCRACGATVYELHHIVYKSLGGGDDELNLIPLCRRCHQAVHDRKLDLLPYLPLAMQAHAVSIIGIERAHRLLAPSVYR